MSVTAVAEEPARLAVPRLLRLRQVLELVPVSRVTLWRMVSSGAFPPPVKLAGSTIAWPDAEVAAWIEARAAARSPTAAAPVDTPPKRSTTPQKSRRRRRRSSR